MILPDELRKLVTRCLAGHQSALIDFVRQFQGQVFGFCYRMLGQREDAEDATQETFMRVLRNLHRWDPEREMEPWLLTIAGNRCRTRLAKRMRAPVHQSLEVPVADRSHEYQIAEQLSEEVQLALLGIRSEYREAFLLFHQQELSYGEIAEAMKVPLGTVKTWVYRARRELIQRLTQRGVVQGSRRELSSIRTENSSPIGSAS